MNIWGCRTGTGFDVNGLGMTQGGRGNISPITINLVDIGIRNGICLGERKEADLEGFWKDLKDILELAEYSLLERFEWIASQPAKSGYFLHENGLMASTLGRKLQPDESIRECLKHNSLAIGYIGIAETMKALFGKTHSFDEDVYKFALSVVEYIHEFTDKATKKHSLNFVTYATPAEGCCSTLRESLVRKYGIIEGVTDRDYITNSHHIPVYDKVSIKDKIDKEAPFARLATGGYICYVEVDSAVADNEEAIESIINYAMSKGITYLAINFPIDTCLSCGFSGDFGEDPCPVCKSDSIERLRRVTGYLTTDYHKFNKGKIAEVLDRVKHSKFSKEI